MVLSCLLWEAPCIGVFGTRHVTFKKYTIHVAQFASIALEKPVLPQIFLFGPFECKIKLPMWGAGQLTGLNIFGIFEPIQPAAKIHNQLGEIYTFSWFQSWPRDQASPFHKGLFGDHVAFTQLIGAGPREKLKLTFFWYNDEFHLVLLLHPGWSVVN